MRLVLGVSLCLAANLGAQLALPKYSTTYSSSRTRGFFFQTPVAFELTHAQVPDERNYGKQMVAIYKLSAAPPAYSQTVSVKPLFFVTGVDSSKLVEIKPPIKFAAKDFVAVLGACGPNSGTVHNSYGAGNYSSKILGQNIKLLRCLIQANLAAVKGVYGMSSEGNGSIARVRLFVKGHGKAEPYGTGTGLGSIVAPGLGPSDPNPPSIGNTGGLVLTPGTTSNTGAILVLGVQRSSVNLGFGTLLAFPFFYTRPVSGPIPAAGSTITWPIPNNSKLVGVKVTFQGAVGVTGGMTLTNGMEWTAGK